MTQSERHGIAVLSVDEMKSTSGGAVWALPVVKTVFKVAGGLLTAASVYDGAVDFANGYKACR
ncbi:MAG: hypothetical protein WD315_02495 [Balneolaceae bacterium]